MIVNTKWCCSLVVHVRVLLWCLCSRCSRRVAVVCACGLDAARSVLVVLGLAFLVVGSDYYTLPWLSAFFVDFLTHVSFEPVGAINAQVPRIWPEILHWTATCCKIQRHRWSRKLGSAGFCFHGTCAFYPKKGHRLRHLPCMQKYYVKIFARPP